MGKKKQRKGALDLDDDEFPEPTEEVIEAGADVAPVAPTSKKQNKGKKGKKAKAKDSGWGSDDEAAGLPEAPAVDDSPAKASGSRATKKQTASAFDVLEANSDDQEDTPSTSAPKDPQEAVNRQTQAANGRKSYPKKASVSDNEATTSDDEDQGNGMVVAEVISVKPHPNADKLKLCSVDIGHDAAQVVTNAANVAPGMKVVFAGVGVQLAGSGLIIKKTSVRGVESFGMLCSAHDIGWSSEADGVLVELPNSAQPGDACPAEAPKGVSKLANGKAGKGGKKGKASAKLFVQDSNGLDEVLDDEPQASDEGVSSVQAAARKAKKGKKKQGAAAGAFAALDVSDEEDADSPAPEDAPESPVAAPARKAKKGKKKQGSAAAGAFAALDVSDDEGNGNITVPDDVLESPIAASARKPKKGKKTSFDASSAFAALDIEDDDQTDAVEPAVDTDEAEAAPAEAALPTRKAKKGKKKGFDANAAFAALVIKGDDQMDEAEPAASFSDVTEDVTAAAEPVRKPKKGKKKIDAASAFAALDNDSADQLDLPSDAPADDAEDAAALPAAKPKKGKKKQADAAAAFAALGLDDGEETRVTGTVDTTEAEANANLEPQEFAAGKSKKGKKSKKKAADMDAIFAALDGEGDAGAVSDAQTNGVNHADEPESTAVQENDSAQAVELKAKGKKKKKGKAAADTEDIDALLAEIGDAPAQPDAASAAAPIPDDPAAAAAVSDEEAASAQTEPTKGKGKKKKKGKAAADTEDIDALLAELDGPPAEQPAETAPPDTGAQLEAAEQPEAAPADTGKGKKKKKKGKAGAAKDEEDLDAMLAELGMAPPAKPDTQPTSTEQPSTEAQAPDEAAAADEADDDAAADAAGDNKEMTAAEKKKAKKKAKEKAKKAAGAGDGPQGAAPAAKKGGKKVSAAVRKMQEEVEARQRAEAEAARLAEEQRIQQEEEERRQEEEERKKREDTERRKAERLERRAQLKREGKLLVGKAKKEAERLAAVREQFLKQAGVNAPTAADAEPAQKKKVVYGKKKPQPKPKAAADLEAQPSGTASEAAETQAAAESSIAAAQAQAEEAKLQAQRAEEEEKTQQAEEAKEASPDSEEEDDWEAAVESWEAVPAIGPAAEEAKRKAQDADSKKALEGAVDAPAAKRSKADAEAQPGRPAAEAKAESEAESESGEESGSEEDSDEDSDEESSSEYSSSEEETDSEEEAEQRLQAAKDKRQARLAEAIAAGSKENLRSPICCILGHVDTGKTKLLDNVRRTNVQDGEAGGITQQIGATYVPDDALLKRTQSLRPNNEEPSLKLPGLLIIDTPGHESFTNLRSRGSSLCDIAILVVDMMHGLEQQTIESINLLKMRKTPFIVALNKIDRLFDWKTSLDAPIQQTLSSQKDHVKREFEERLKQSILNLNEQGLNVALYWKNPDRRKYVNVVPTSAITGEGIPDMLQLLVDLTQSMMASRLMVISETQCTVLEVKVIEGLGTTVDVVLVNGMLHEGDTIVLCGMGGAIVTQIRSLLTPHPLKELRVRGSYLHHKQIKAAQGVKIAAQNLESAVAGTQMLVAGPNDDIEALKDEVMEDMADIFSSVDRSGEGVCVQASTLGSLEALLEFLKSPAVKIPVSGINIGPVHKRDVMRASVMLEKGRQKYACLLAFDVAVTREARELSESLGVKVFTADIIYHLFDQFTAYLKTVKDEEQEAAKFDAVFPCILRILPNCVFNKKDPIVVGVDIEEGIAKVGTPLCIPTQGGIEIGRITSMELNHKPVDTAKRGESVAMKIEPSNAAEATRLYGRHFDFKDPLVSKISRKSIDLLKQHFKDEMSKDDWKLVIKLKGTFRID